MSAPIPLKCRLVPHPLKMYYQALMLSIRHQNWRWVSHNPYSWRWVPPQMQVSAPPLKKRIQFVRKNRFENEIEGQGQSNPKSIGIFNKAKIHFWSQFGNITWIGDELSHEQAQNEVNFDFQVKFDLKGQGQSTPKTTEILTKVFWTSGPNLMILAWNKWQVIVWKSLWFTHRQTDGFTDAGNNNTQRPKPGHGLKTHILIHVESIVTVRAIW